MVFHVCLLRMAGLSTHHSASMLLEVFTALGVYFWFATCCAGWSAVSDVEGQHFSVVRPDNQGIRW